MRRAACAAAFAFAALAHAQSPPPPANPNAQAKELATRLGREQSLEGLETIIAARNVDLFNAYEHGWREATAGKPLQPLAPAFEALLIRHYPDPVMGPALRTLCTANWTPCHTREMFDLMLAEWRSGNVRRSTYSIRDAVLRMDIAGMDAPLLEWLQAREAPAGEDLKQVVAFLGRRHYEPAIPVLKSLLWKPDREVAYVAAIALLDIGSPATVDAVLDRMEATKGPLATANAEETRQNGYLLQRIAQLPPALPLPYARLRRALADDNRAYATTWLTQRKDLAAVPDVLALLGDAKAYPGALNALVASDSPEVWKRARGEVDRLRGNGLNEGQYAYASKLLDDKLADPRKHFAEQKQVERNKEFNEKNQALGPMRAAAEKLRDSPDAYIRESRKHLAAAQGLVEQYRDLPQAAVGLQAEVGNKYVELGHLARFRLKDPARAIELYEAARRDGNGLAALAIADTYQFDLGDRAQALRRYAAMRDGKPAAQAHNDIEASLEQFTRAWLAHQVAFLAKGTTFSGPVRPDSCAAVALFLVYGGGVGATGDYLDFTPVQRLLAPRPGVSPGAQLQEADRRSLAKFLGELPASAFVLMRAAGFVAQLPDANAILAFLARQDPAGFASACYFSMEAADPGGSTPAYRSAAARFNREHRVAAVKADPRMSTPEGTWNLLIESLKKGDSATAMGCLTPGQQNKFRVLFEEQPPERMRAMAESFSGFSLTRKMGEDAQEAFVASGKNGGFVYFVRTGGVWKINEM